jgi:hypothetical protein
MNECTLGPMTLVNQSHPSCATNSAFIRVGCDRGIASCCDVGCHSGSAESDSQPAT